jgi:predicted nucleotidyltransferase
MLELDQVDLQDLSAALEDHSDFHSWWLDPHTGAIEVWSEELGEDDERHPAERGWLPIEPVDSSDAYRDMVDFIDGIAEPHASDLLSRAIEGRGAFRRFKDTVSEFPELRDAWFDLHRIRMERRAIEWLRHEGVIDAEAARRATNARPDPDMTRGIDPLAIARAVASDLRQLYGGRLRDVRLYGSWARGDAHPDSDIDLLVVLDQFSSRWSERQRMEDILWRHSFENDVVVSAHPVGEGELARSASPFVARIGAEAAAIV